MIEITSSLMMDATGCSSASAAVYAKHIDEACRLWAINTKLRVAAFLAQMAHESALFGATEENLNYRVETIKRMAANSPPGSRWRALGERAATLARNPEGLANAAYGGRMGNRPEASGDGWRYRGRGLKQLTGRTNYEVIGDAVKKRIPDAPSFVENPDIVALPRWAALSAGAFWDENHLNALADASLFRKLTVRINGGENGLVQRQAMYRSALKALGV